MCVCVCVCVCVCGVDVCGCPRIPGHFLLRKAAHDQKLLSFRQLKAKRSGGALRKKRRETSSIDKMKQSLQ